MNPEEVKKVGVVGCGIMGSGIVEVCAKAGFDVTFVEVDDARVERGRTAIERSLRKAAERGKLEGTPEDVLVRITGSTSLQDLAGADLIIEAITENLPAKKETFNTLDGITKPEVVLATNTSTLSIGEMAAMTTRPDKVVGLHFFNPAAIMKLLEIVRGIATSDETVEFARGFGERIGKTTVLAKDRAGFIVNFLLIPYLNAAVQMLDDGRASREDIDAGIQLGLGHPMGPLTLLDLIGLDTAVHASNALYEEFKDPVYAPPPLLKRMVTAGYLGRKSGRGFYDYG
jgi:3-hydroxybutyryl-CoA dehydrogenase